MEKRMTRPGSLNGFLLGFLVRTGLACAAVGLVWLALTFLFILSGFVLPASSGSDATIHAAELLNGQTAATFTPGAMPELSRWVLLAEPPAADGTADAGSVLATNMDTYHLERALGLQYALFNHQYYRDVTLADGTVCRLQYDFSAPYADPALRAWLPDYQNTMLVLLVLLLVIVIVFMTRRSARRLRAETARLTEACRVLAGGDLSAPMPAASRIAEFQDALQTMDTLRGELSQSLKAQWTMEQQRSERIAALAHDLKTPLAILQGNAELLAEEPLTDTQRPAVEAMLRGCERAGQYLAALRRVGRMEDTPAPAEPLDGTAFIQALAQTGRALCTPRRLHFVLDNALPPGTVLYARRQDTARAVENLLDNAVRYAAPGGQVTLRCTREADALAFAVQDDGPGFAPAVLRGGGQLLYTGDAARSDGHQGLGLYFARRVAESQGGSLTLANTPTGALVVLRLPPGHAPA